MRSIKISKKRSIVLFALIVCVSVVIVVAVLATAPKKGKIISSAPVRHGAEGYSIKQLDGHYMSFSYSGIYVANNEGPKDSFVELYMLRAATNYDKQISASVAEIPGGNLESNGPYLHRKQRPDLYQSRKVEVEGRLVNVWVKNDGTEQTAIMPYGDKVVTLSFTSAGQNNELSTEVDSLLKTFHWKL